MDWEVTDPPSPTETTREQYMNTSVSTLQRPTEKLYHQTIIKPRQDITGKDNSQQLSH